eukprot:3798867-Prymnesium_polylepis.1
MLTAPSPWTAPAAATPGAEPSALQVRARVWRPTPTRSLRSRSHRSAHGTCHHARHASRASRPVDAPGRSATLGVSECAAAARRPLCHTPP